MVPPCGHLCTYLVIVQFWRNFKDAPDQNMAEHAVQFYAAGIGGRGWGKGRAFSPKLLE